MSKVKLLLDVVEDLRSLADSVNAVAQAIAENEQPKNPDEVTKQPQPAPVVEPQPVEAEEAPPMDESEKARLMLETRTKLEVYCKNGWRPEVFALIAKYAPKLSEMDPKDYPALLQEVEEKCHGTK